MKLERVNIPIWVPTRLLDLLVIPAGVIWMIYMLLWDHFARDENGRIP